MAEEDNGDTSNSPSGDEAKKSKSKEKLVIGLGIVGLYLAYKSYKNSTGASTSTSTTGTTTSSTPPTVDPTAALNTLSTEIGALAQQQATNTSSIASWQATPGPTGATGPAGPAAPLANTYASGAGTYNFPNNSPIVGAVAAGSSGGLYETNAQGQVYALGGAQYYGGLNLTGANNRVVSILPNSGGYTLVDAAGGTYNFGPNSGQSTGQVVDTSTVPAKP